MKTVFDEARLSAIRAMMHYYRVPGLAFAVFTKDGETEMHCLGDKNAEAGEKVNPSTRFCMASISKSFTSAVVARLCDEGKLDLDRPVTDFVPELQYREKRMALKDMMSHRSGLANHDALWPGEQTREELAKRMRYLDSNLPFRTQYQYNNTQFVMAGYAAEAVTGRGFEALLKEFFLDPLGMTETTATEAGIKASGNMAEPYRVFGTARRRLPFWNMDLAVPAAGVNSSLNDMVKWVRFHMMGGVTPEGKRLISRDLFREIHTPHIGEGAEPVISEDPLILQGYGLGWRIGEYRGTPLQMHNGKIEGYSSSQVYLPEKGVGVVIMMNLHDPELPLFRGILYDALDGAAFGMRSGWLARFSKEGDLAGASEYRELFADYTPKDFGESASLSSFGENVLSESGGPFAGTRENQVGAEKPAGTRENQADAEKFAGTYENPGYGEVTVYEEEGRLMLHYRDQDLPLQRMKETRFVMDGVKEDTWILRVPVEFVSGDRCGDRVLIKYDADLPPIPFVKK